MKQDPKDEGKGTSVFEKHMQKTTNKVTRNVVTRDFLKKYLSFVKSQKAPELDGDCIEYAAQLYSVIRQKAAFSDQNKISCPVTVRTLETLIRLATAHSKLHLQKTVTSKDIDIAVNMIHLSIFGEPMDEEEGDDDMDLNEAAGPKAGAKDKSSKMEVDTAPNAGKKRVKFGGEDDDFQAEAGGSTGARRITRRQTGPKQAPAAAPAEEQRPASKKMKVDEEQQVNELFQSSIRADVSKVDISVKKFVFKLVSDISNAERSSKVNINQIWKKFFGYDAAQQKDPESGKTYLNSKEDLKNVLDQMCADDLAMMDGDDVILTE